MVKIIVLTLEQLVKKAKETNPLQCSIIELIKLLENKAELIYANRLMEDKGAKLYESMAIYKTGVFYAVTLNKVKSLKKYSSK